MFRNYLKIAFRNIIRERNYSLINIFGLSLGISCTLAIFLYVAHQKNYDLEHPDVDRLFRVNQTNIWDPEGGMMGSTPPSIALALKEEFPEIETLVRVNTLYDQNVRYLEEGQDPKVFLEPNVLGADAEFFSLFNFPLKYGDPETALKEVNSVVISSEAALKYFGDEMPMGRTLYIGEERWPVKVTGVTEAQPENQHFQFNFLVSIYTNPRIEQFEWSWIWTQVATYAKLKPGTSSVDLDDKMDGLAAKYANEAFARLSMTLESFEAEKGKLVYDLQPVPTIHLESADIGNRLGNLGNKTTVDMLIWIAALLIVMACVNFMNLSTARSFIRAREIGVRKVMGSLKRDLVMQFLVESVCMAFLAVVLGLGILEGINLIFQKLMGINILGLIPQSNWFWFLVLGTPLLLGLVAGSYPAFFMTRFDPITALKGKKMIKMKDGGVRNLLVGVQFLMAIIMISATLIIYQQLNYFQNRPIGFNRDNLLIIQRAELLGDKLDVYAEDLRSQTEFSSVAVGLTVPGQGGNEDFMYKPESPDEEIPVNMLKIDENYLSTMGIDLLVGRNYIQGSNGSGIIINETAMKQFGWDVDNVMGQQMNYYNEHQFEVIGVVKDFNYNSLHYNVVPMALIHVDTRIWGERRVVIGKFKNQDLQAMLSKVEEKWKAVTDVPMEYTFMDLEIQNMYRTENQTGTLFASFSIIAVFICCIGLLGLSAYMIEQRRKEIGIRKVLGSTVSGIMMLLNSGLTRLVLISSLLAIPVSWFIMQRWLEQFYFRISIGPLVFISSVLLALIILWATVSIQSLKAAMANPVDSMKEE